MVQVQSIRTAPEYKARRAVGCHQQITASVAVKISCQATVRFRGHKSRELFEPIAVLSTPIYSGSTHRAAASCNGNEIRSAIAAKIPDTEILDARRKQFHVELFVPSRCRSPINPRVVNTCYVVVAAPDDEFWKTITIQVSDAHPHASNTRILHSLRCLSGMFGKYIL